MKEAGNRSQEIVQGIYKGIDITVAILLLTGQISIGGILINQDYFTLSLTGAITGREVTGITRQAQLVHEGLDVITAILIILDQLNVLGSYLVSQRFLILIGGPLLGMPKTEAYAPSRPAFWNYYSTELLKLFLPI